MAKGRVAGGGATPPRSEAARTGKRRRAGGAAPRGRTWVALVIAGFLLLLLGVIWRRAVGRAQALELQVLETRRTQLDAQRSQLESDIRDLSSRAKLAPAAESRLHMHVPNDTELVILRRTPRTP
jgi:cell division protein FtsL